MKHNFDEIFTEALRARERKEVIAKITIVEAEYHPAQRNLITIWNDFLDKCHKGMAIWEVGLILKYPRSRGRYRQRLLGLPVQSIGSQKDYEILRIKPMNFVVLMAKSGIKLNIEEGGEAFG